MKPWEIWTADVGFGPHPCVVVSHPARCTSAKPQVVVLFCSSQRAQREAAAHEAVLDESDGLDWPTLCKCDLLWTVNKTDLTQRRGLVGVERRRDIARRVIGSLAFAGL